MLTKRAYIEFHAVLDRKVIIPGLDSGLDFGLDSQKWNVSLVEMLESAVVKAGLVLVALSVYTYHTNS